MLTFSTAKNLLIQPLLNIHGEKAKGLSIIPIGMNTPTKPDSFQLSKPSLRSGNEVPLDELRRPLFPHYAKALSFLHLNLDPDSLAQYKNVEKTDNYTQLAQQLETAQQQLKEKQFEKLQKFMPAVLEIEQHIIANHKGFEQYQPNDIRIEWLMDDTIVPALRLTAGKANNPQEAANNQKARELIFKVALQNKAFGAIQNFLDMEVDNSPFLEGDLTKLVETMGTPERLRRYVDYLEAFGLKRISGEIKNKITDEGTYQTVEKELTALKVVADNTNKLLTAEQRRIDWKRTRGITITALENNRPDLVQPYVLALDKWLYGELPKNAELRRKIEQAISLDSENNPTKTMGKELRIEAVQKLNTETWLPLHEMTPTSLNNGLHPNILIVADLLKQAQSPQSIIHCSIVQLEQLKVKAKEFKGKKGTEEGTAILIAIEVVENKIKTFKQKHPNLETWIDLYWNFFKEQAQHPERFREVL